MKNMIGIICATIIVVIVSATLFIIVKIFNTPPDPGTRPGSVGIAKDGDGKWHTIITDDKGYVICSPSSQLSIQPGQPIGCIDCGFHIPWNNPIPIHSETQWDSSMADDEDLWTDKGKLQR